MKFWIRTFEKSGIEGLESKVKNPKKPKLDIAQKEQIRSWIESDPNVTMKKLKSMIRKNFNIEISLVGIWKNVQKMDFAHITARSVHYKQDKEKLEEFKKTLIAIKAKNPNKPILYFDESRFGIKTKTALGWFVKGSRTPIKVKLGFKNFYLYSSVDPSSGKSFSLLMPNVDTACMNVFLEELAEEIKEDFILIMDGAGWRKSKNLIVPKNIQIFLLPPYCLELSPVEILWKFIKDNTIKIKSLKH